MKKQAYMIITMIMLLTVAGLSTAKAQTSGNPRVGSQHPVRFQRRREDVAGWRIYRSVHESQFAYEDPAAAQQGWTR